MEVRVRLGQLLRRQHEILLDLEMAGGDVSRCVLRCSLPLSPFCLREAHLLHEVVEESDQTEQDLPEARVGRVLRARQDRLGVSLDDQVFFVAMVRPVSVTAAPRCTAAAPRTTGPALSRRS
jgi:hypothetical protein